MNSVLARQLRRAGLDPSTPPQDEIGWRLFLDRIEQSYSDADQNRYLLERSLRMSNQEMTQLNLELRRGLESEVAKERDRLRDVIDALADGVCTLDGEGRVSLANAAAARLLGASERTLIGSWVLDSLIFDRTLATSETKSRTQVLSFVIAGGSYSNDKSVIRRSDGSLIPVDCLLNPMWRGSRVEGIVLVLRDLTQQLQAAEAVARSESRYRVLFESSPVAMLEEDFTGVSRWIQETWSTGVVDPHAYFEAHPDELRRVAARIQITAANSACLELLEADGFDDIAGMLKPEVLSPSALWSIGEQVAAVWNRQDRLTLDLEGLSLRGKRIDGILNWGVARVGDHFDLQRVVVAITDISSLREAEARMSEIIRSKDEFLAAISHELRTPLTSVYGNAEVLREQRETLEPAERDELLELIVKESSDLGYIIQDLLVAARSDIGAVVIAASPLRLADEVQRVRDGLYGLDKHSVRLGQLEGWVYADQHRLRQIVRNLLTNAVRYGGSEISIESIEQGDMVVLRVADNGPGIPAEEQEAIFLPYHRASRLKGLAGSVGLGLSIARTLARLMGGELRYHQQDGWSRFDLELPAAVQTALAS